MGYQKWKVALIVCTWTLDYNNQRNTITHHTSHITCNLFCGIWMASAHITHIRIWHITIRSYCSVDWTIWILTYQTDVVKTKEQRTSSSTRKEHSQRYVDMKTYSCDTVLSCVSQPQENQIATAQSMSQFHFHIKTMRTTKTKMDLVLCHSLYRDGCFLHTTSYNPLPTSYPTNTNKHPNLMLMLSYHPAYTQSWFLWPDLRMQMQRQGWGEVQKS
jgi:hypothetical protein